MIFKFIAAVSHDVSVRKRSNTFSFSSLCSCCRCTIRMAMAMCVYKSLLKLMGSCRSLCAWIPLMKKILPWCVGTCIISMPTSWKILTLECKMPSFNICSCCFFLIFVPTSFVTVVDSVPFEKSHEKKEVHENNEILHQVNSAKQTFGDLRNRDVWGDLCRPFTHPDVGPWENWGQALNLWEICSMATSSVDSFLLVPGVFKEADNQGVDAKSKGCEGIQCNMYIYIILILNYPMLET